MKRRIGLLLALVIWVMIGKMIARSENLSERQVTACVEEQLVRSVKQTYDLTYSHNFKVENCDSGTADCHQASFQAAANDGTVYNGRISVAWNDKDGCRLVSESGQGLSLKNSAGADFSGLADIK